MDSFGKYYLRDIYSGLLSVARICNTRNFQRKTSANFPLFLGAQGEESLSSLPMFLIRIELIRPKRTNFYRLTLNF